MKRLLFLSHCVPWPADKGEKIRAHHILAHLTQHYQVHAGFLGRSDKELAAANPFAGKLAASAGFLADPKVQKRAARNKQIKRWLHGDFGAPMMPDFYQVAGLRAWVDAQCAEFSFDVIYIYTVAMAPYVIGHVLPGDQIGARRILDAVDIDSEKWAAYAEDKKFPENWFWTRESRTLLKYETACTAASEATLFVSENEAARFRDLAPALTNQIRAVENGVDLDYFSPALEFASPYEPGAPVLLFTGAMDYWPNIDAALWFAREILPSLAARGQPARFVIAGGNPSAEILALPQQNPHITVTGYVPDMRPYLAHADAVVCPLRLARGIQNKVLEAMAMGKPVIATAEAATGLHVEYGRDLLIGRGKGNFIRNIEVALKTRGPTIGTCAREAMERHYPWPHVLAPLDKILRIER
jgi:sugar transferase (PEP-CTERM/EpsH1 system associated)